MSLSSVRTMHENFGQLLCPYEKRITATALRQSYGESHKYISRASLFHLKEEEGILMPSLTLTLSQTKQRDDPDCKFDGFLQQCILVRSCFVFVHFDFGTFICELRDSSICSSMLVLVVSSSSFTSLPVDWLLWRPSSSPCCFALLLT
jgi:hypothetical protein